MPSPYFTGADVDAIWSKDINSSPSVSNLAYTSLFTVFTNTNEIKTGVDGLVTAIADLATAVAALGADLDYVRDKLDALTADPADPEQGHDHVIVAAVEWADAN
jgi:hypothetical protein